MKKKKSHSISDCFERVSIGEKLPRDDIYRNVSELTTVECEQICKQDKQCQSYDYGYVIVLTDSKDNNNIESGSRITYKSLVKIINFILFTKKVKVL